jgi:hypothetical protein
VPTVPPAPVAIRPHRHCESARGGTEHCADSQGSIRASVPPTPGQVTASDRSSPPTLGHPLANEARRALWPTTTTNPGPVLPTLVLPPPAPPSRSISDGQLDMDYDSSIPRNRYRPSTGTATTPAEDSTRHESSARVKDDGRPDAMLSSTPPCGTPHACTCKRLPLLSFLGL